MIDAYSVQPIDRDGLVAAGKATGGRIITVEDHYAHGGLGDAVSEAVWDQGFRVQRLAVREIPRSGPPEVLLDRYGISARAIVAAVRAGRKVEATVKGQRSKAKLQRAEVQGETLVALPAAVGRAACSPCSCL